MKYNYTEKQKEEISELLSEHHDRIITNIKVEALYDAKVLTEQFKLDKGLTQPTLEAKKWYKSYNGVLKFFLTETTTYGFRATGSWDELENGYDLNCIFMKWKEVTHEEVKTALIKQWEKANEPFEEYEYHSPSANKMNNNQIYGWNGNESASTLFDNGTWFPIDKPEVNEFTIKELEELTGKTNIKIIK